MNIKELVTELDSQMTEVFDYYCQQHEQFRNVIEQLKTKYIDQPIDKQEDVDLINSILKNIEDSARELSDGFHYIITRHEQTRNAINDYNNFVKWLLEAGIKAKDKSEEIQ